MNSGEQLGDIARGVQMVVLKLHRLERENILKDLAFVPSSIHSETMLKRVMDYYQGDDKGERRCIVSGFVDPGKGGDLPMIERVIAAHIVPSSKWNIYLNLSDSGRRVLNADQPYSCILLQKKLEVLFDRHAWCLIPSNPMKNAYEVTVKVLVHPNNGVGYASFKQRMPREYLEVVDDWIRQLQKCNGQTISFQEGRTPSFRALALHAHQSMVYANAMNFVTEEELIDFDALDALSPMKSNPVSEADADDDDA
jgi:hypothetical protein